MRGASLTASAGDPILPSVVVVILGISPAGQLAGHAIDVSGDVDLCRRTILSVIRASISRFLSISFFGGDIRALSMVRGFLIHPYPSVYSILYCIASVETDCHIEGAC